MKKQITANITNHLKTRNTLEGMKGKMTLAIILTLTMTEWFCMSYVAVRRFHTFTFYNSSKRPQSTCLKIFLVVTQKRMAITVH